VRLFPLKVKLKCTKYECFLVANPLCVLLWHFAYLAADTGAPSMSDCVALLLSNIQVYVFSMWYNCAAICSVVNEVCCSCFIM
jgi:hypothetical protein